MAKPDISVVAGLLTDRIEQLVHELLPNGKLRGHEWQCGSLAGEAGYSLSVNIGPARPGVWKDFSSSDDYGDAFDLVAKCLFGGDKKQALAWSISWLGLDDADPERLKQQRRSAEQRSRERAAADKKAKDKTRKMARKMWIDLKPDLLETPVDAYLKGRGIDLSKLNYQPRSIRFSPGVREPSTGKDFPCMLTAINGVDGNFAAVHRTFLQIKADGIVAKADVPRPKMVLGTFKGGCIRLWRGEYATEHGEIKRGQPWNKIKQSERLYIVEGIEDGLTIALMASDRRVAVSVTLSHLADMLLPECFDEICIVADNDIDNPQADAALQKAVSNFQRQGRKVLISRAPEGYKDINDYLNGVK